MVVLTRKNLGERQRELNDKVTETATRNVDFNQLRDANEQCDIDRLFKIGVASKYKNVDYIVDVLKSGDPLYISKALKCEWLFSDEYSNIINCDYLHENVFPLMSSKMKNKLLSTISIHVRNSETRAASFYTYCKNAKLNNLAFKFLIFTSERFKLELFTKTTWDIDGISERPSEYTQQFIQNSFHLARAYLEHFQHMRGATLHELRYLYSVSNTKYLDLLEEFVIPCNLRIRQLGLRLSKDIITKHKDRVLNNPRTYITILQNNILVKHSNAEDAKVYAKALLPEEDQMFWNRHFCITYNYIIDLIPQEDRFEFMKKIFNDKYPNKPFETTREFYDSKYFTMMTPETREVWALQHVESEMDLLGVGNDYIWYKFVSFEKAFVEIKKLIMITPDKEKRLKMVHVLVESAKNQRELEKLMNYFYERHVNELRYAKEQFLDEVLYSHNLLKFEESCWTSFNKILYSLEVYSVTGYNNSKVEHRIIALIYHIIKKKEVPEALQHYINSNLNLYTLMNNIHSRLDKEEEEMVYEYLFDFYIEKLNKIYDGEVYNENVKHQVRNYIHYILDVLHKFKRPKSDCPEIIMKLIKLDWNEYGHHVFLYEKEETSKQITQDTFISFLKKDATLVVDKLPEVKRIIEQGFDFKLNLFLRKLKVYYPNDLSIKCVDFFNELLSEDKIHLKVAQTAVYVIFQCADDHFKVEFMKKYAPLEWKIDHTNIDQNLLYTQQAICAYACISRPPVPLENVLAYIKGDYVKHCLPLFNSYLANLPTPLCIKFVESIIDAPLSVQKHGIRLAFVCFSTDNLVQLITSAWKKTKNVSLRLVIYEALFNKIVAEEKDNQIKLYKSLKAFTLDIHEDDDSNLFSILRFDRLPEEILGDYIETAWTTLAEFSQKTINLQRLNEVLKSIHRNMKLIRKELIEAIIDKHIKAEFAEKHGDGDETDKNVNNEKLVWMNAIVSTKWDITAEYLTYINNEDELASKVEITKMIMKLCIEKWNEVHYNSYTVRRLCLRFINDLNIFGYQHDETCYKYANVVLENILKMLQDSFSVEEIYTLIWQLKLNTIARRVIVDGKAKKLKITVEDDMFAMIRDIGLNLANEFGFLINEFVKKDIYYTTFMQEIENELVSTMERVMVSFRDHNFCKVDNNDFRVIVCFGLTQLKKPETNLLALKLVPLDYNGHYIVDYTSVLMKLKKIEDKEFRCVMRHKFINSDLTFRKFWQF